MKLPKHSYNNIRSHMPKGMAIGTALRVQHATWIKLISYFCPNKMPKLDPDKKTTLYIAICDILTYVDW